MASTNITMETPKKQPNILSQSDRRKSQIFQYRPPNLSYDDRSLSSSSSHHGTTLFHTDSGYTSESLSFDSPEAYHRSHRSSAGVSHLEPIIEGVIFNCPSTDIELTPTTKNLNQLNDFHITTPLVLSNKRTATSPIKTIDSSSASKSRRLTPTNSNQNVTPRKANGIHRQRSFMDKLDDLENIENTPSADFYPDRMEFSPIVGQRIAAFTRQPSEHSLQSSTPIQMHWSSRIKGNTGHKILPAASRRIRKTQSFSPSKFFLSKYDLKAAQESSPIVLSLPSPKPYEYSSPMGKGVNPARKLLDFNDGAFESLIKSVKPKPVVKRQSNVNDSDLDISFSTPKKQTPPSTPTTPKPDSNCSIATRNNTDILFHSDIIIESPNFHPLCQQDFETPKKLSRSVSLSSPQREQNEILFANLPCTPPKSATKRKRPASTKTSRRSPVKRKLYESRKRCLIGMENVDILGRLEFVCPAIDRICKFLSTIDLANFRLVSKRWCRILESNKRALHRVEREARRQEVSKENLNSKLLPKDDVLCHKTRIPFSLRNSLTKGAIILAPETALVSETSTISPKTRAFQEYQKLIKNLTKTQRLMKCPRCSSASIVDQYNATSPTILDRQSTPRLGMITKHQSCPIPFQKGDSINIDDSGVFGISVDFNYPISSFSNRSTNQTHIEDHVLEFGRCTGKTCGFVFCVDCLREAHGDQKCPELDDIPNPDTYAACTKQSKRNLRRLCSLDP